MLNMGTSSSASLNDFILPPSSRHRRGLAIVHRIIQHHSGGVSAEGQLERGASVFFTIPRSAASTR